MPNGPPGPKEIVSSWAEMDAQWFFNTTTGKKIQLNFAEWMRLSVQGIDLVSIKGTEKENHLKVLYGK